MERKCSPKVEKLILQYQRDEVTGSILYEKLAKRAKDEKNKTALLKIAADERQHAGFWQDYCGKRAKPNRLKIFLYSLIAFFFGYTFAIKLMEKGELFGIKDYERVKQEIPEVNKIIADEEEHEDILLGMLDEERLQYVGAMVLGLNDALVELTGAIAGLTFAMQDTRMVALSAIITGAAATLSMAASNYLAERANNNPKALRSSFYTGLAYLVTVVLMVLPYLLYPTDMYVAAFVTMLAVVILVILVFNFYVSVAKSTPFFARFREMLLISLGVAGVSFVIGLLAKQFLGVDV